MFSILQREDEYKKIQNQKNIDLIIIGGGITGAGILLDAVSRGLNAILFEKKDFAFGTSSRSTKLVHGGLRYLKNLEFALVAEVGKERAIVHKNAMHIVIPEKMVLPIIKGGTLGKFSTSVALFMYDFLAGVKKEERYKTLSRKKTIEFEPVLENDILLGSAVYYEYKTEDSRLTIEVMKKAVELGGKAFNYAEVTDLIYDDNHKIKGVKVYDKILNKEFEFFADYIVNATGIWVDDFRKKDGSLKGKKLHITKGVHIVVDRKKLPLKHSIYFDVPTDERMVFAIPKNEKIYIGTTDTNYNKDLDNPDITKEDVQYLINAINFIAPKYKLSIEDVESAWSGLRPLIHQEGKSPSELSRKDEIFISESGLISIAGGKLTGYRLMAKKIVDLLRKKIKKQKNIDIGHCKTQNIKLSGGNFDFEEMFQLIDFADSKYDEAKETKIQVADFKKLFYRYGTNIDLITEKAYEFYNKNKNTDLAWLEAEIWYSVFEESSANIVDFFLRRNSMLLFDIHKTKNIYKDAIDIFAKYLNWNENQINENIKLIEDEFKIRTNFS